MLIHQSARFNQPILPSLSYTGKIRSLYSLRPNASYYTKTDNNSNLVMFLPPYQAWTRLAFGEHVNTVLAAAEAVPNEIWSPSNSPNLLFYPCFRPLLLHESAQNLCDNKRWKLKLHKSFLSRWTPTARFNRGSGRPPGDFPRSICYNDCSSRPWYCSHLPLPRLQHTLPTSQVSTFRSGLEVRPKYTHSTLGLNFLDRIKSSCAINIGLGYLKRVI